MDRSTPTNEHSQPLLDEDRDIELSQLDGDASLSSHVSSIHHRVPGAPLSPYLIALVLAISIAGLVVSTEAAAYYEDVLGWNKPFASLYLSHSSLALPWLCHLAYLRVKQIDKSYSIWVRDYNNQLRASISSVEAFAVTGPSMVFKRSRSLGGLDYLSTAMVIVTAVLTVSGISWFTALELTTPSDLTAIYNCSTFFAAVFSVPLLKQKLGSTSIIAVALSIFGTLVIAYGDMRSPSEPTAAKPQVGSSRLLGNLCALVGAVAFGLYEVLFKRWACPSRAESPESSLTLTLAASALTGIYTFSTF